MGMMDALGDKSGGQPPRRTADAGQDFEKMAAYAGAGMLEEGIAEAFRSDDTPPFEDMVAQLFERSDPVTRAGMLDNLLAGLGANSLAALHGGALADVLRRYLGGARVSPSSTGSVDPDDVREAARQARRQNAGVVERVSRYYARHPDLVRSLGSEVIGVVLARMAQSTRH